MPQAQPVTAAVHSAPTCDRDKCAAPAVFSYSWEWGESGVCCGTHQFLLNQSAQQIGRAVQFASLVAVGPAPMDRPERVRLKSEAYALEMELEEAKGRGLDLYRSNETLTRQVQAHTARGRETEAQLRDAGREIERLKLELEKRDAEHGGMVEELERLRTLSKFVDPPQNKPAATSEAYGLLSGAKHAPPQSEETTRVDGATGSTGPKPPKKS